MTTKMIALPAMPSKKANKPSRPCACGCGMLTKSTWHTGHDGRATGWARRVETGVMTLDEVPANERRGAEIMLRRHGWKPEEVKATGTDGK